MADRQPPFALPANRLGFSSAAEEFVDEEGEGVGSEFAVSCCAPWAAAIGAAGSAAPTRITG